MIEKSKKILIIEDDAMLMRLLTKHINKEGIEVLNANNGRVGLQIGKKECPKLIILDVIMPKMDGLTVIKGLRNDSNCKNIPVFLWTNLSKSEVGKTITDKNIEYLAKSELSLKDLVKKVVEYVK